MKIKDKRESDEVQTQFQDIDVGTCFKLVGRRKIYQKTIDDISGHYRYTDPHTGVSSPMSPSAIVTPMPNVKLVIDD